MPDKDFDKLFTDKFADAEIQPSADLWANIEKQLAPRKKRIIPIYWMAAASMAIVISAMLVFNKKDVIKLQGLQETATATVTKPNVKTNLVDVEKPTKVIVQTQVSNNASDVKVTVQNLVGKELSPKQVEDDVKNMQLALQPIDGSGHLPINKQEVKPLAIVPIQETVMENPIVIASVQVSPSIDDNTISESGVERRGIKNVGDLVNFVVEKVDKREKKLLRFNTDDDDNSSLIGINIGFLKFNKKGK